MIEDYKYEKRYHYPHMGPADKEIWERFIDKFPAAYDVVSYDVKVGSPPPFDPTVNDATAGDASDLYKKKIDVIGYGGGKIDIIELKPRAGASALGQVKGYIELYKRDIAPKSTPNGILITDILLPDMEMLAETMGVKLFIV